MAQQHPATGHPVQAQRQSLDGYNYMSQSYEDLSAQQVCFKALRRRAYEKHCAQCRLGGKASRTSGASITASPCGIDSVPCALTSARVGS